MLDSLSLVLPFQAKQRVGSDLFRSNPHHACCRKTSELKHTRFSRQPACPVQVGPPEDSSVVEYSSPAHPAAGFSGLTSQAHAGSTAAAHKVIVHSSIYIHTCEMASVQCVPLWSAILSLREALCVFLRSLQLCCIPLRAS